jgi:hypothetical protein
VHVRLRREIDDQRHALAGCCGRIADGDGGPQLPAVDDRWWCGRDRAADPGDQPRGGRTLLICLLERALDDAQIGTDNERPRMRDADLAAARGVIAQAPRVDRARLWIAQQRKRNAVPVGKRGEDFTAVVADRDEPESFLADERQVALQLDQLRAAIRSPIGRSEEDDQCPLRTGNRLETLRLSAVVGEREVGDASADLRPERGDVDGGLGRQRGRERRQGDQD